MVSDLVNMRKMVSVGSMGFDCMRTRNSSRDMYYLLMKMEEAMH